MTRYTNFARKRTYVEASFNNNSQAETTIAENAGAPTEEVDTSGDAASELDLKKRRHGKSRKTQFSNSGTKSGGGEQNETTPTQDGENGEKVKGEESSEHPMKRARIGDKYREGGFGNHFDKRRPKVAKTRKSASEQRRLKRIDDRNADTVCFACREKGHTARNCTNTLAADALEGEKGRSTVKSGRDAVGICYRCGSRRHNLSKCSEPVDPANPLPFASCFVCSGKGHLASKCPQNQSRGIYPNGGCCKLCKETTHLAKDCPMRKQEVVASTLFVGTGGEGGADEDDFHMFKRMTAEVDKAEKAEDKAKRRVDVKVGAHSGVVKAFGNAPTAKKKKVVFF